MMHAAAPNPTSAQPALPLALEDHVALVLAGTASRAFATVRAQQLLDYGHDDDADHAIDYLARQALGRVQAFLERAGSGAMEPPAEHREYLKRKLEIAGGLLLAAHDRLLRANQGDAS